MKTDYKKSIINAIIDNYKIIDKTCTSCWGRKFVYLGYNDIQGWHVSELSLFGYYLRKMNLICQDTHLKDILKRLDDLTKEEATFLYKGKIHEKFPKLQEKIGEIYKKHHHRAPPPSSTINSLNPSSTSKSSLPIQTDTKILRKKQIDIDKEIAAAAPSRAKVSKMKKRVNSSSHLPDTSSEKILPPLSPSISRQIIKEKTGKKTSRHSDESVTVNSIQIDDIKSENPSNAPLAKAPLYLKNYLSRCYLDSVMELLLSQDCIRNKIFALCEQQTTSPEYQNILESIKGLIVSADKIHQEKKVPPKLGTKDSFAEKVREAIFKSGFNEDFDQNSIYKQQDCTPILLLLNTILGISFETETIDSAQDPFNNQNIVSTRREINFTLPLSIGNSKERKLQHLLDEISKPQQAGERKFEQATNPNENLPYKTQTTIATFPDIITLQIKRYGFREGENSKFNYSIILPQDGILSLSCDQNKKKEAQYEITGYVTHHGSRFDCGHYAANIKISNNYFKCDNSFCENYFEKISAKEFYSNKNAYLVMLKKIP